MKKRDALLEHTPRLPRSAVRWALLPTVLWRIAILLTAWLLWKRNGGKKENA